MFLDITKYINRLIFDKKYDLICTRPIYAYMSYLRADLWSTKRRPSNLIRMNKAKVDERVSTSCLKIC